MSRSYALKPIQTWDCVERLKLRYQQCEKMNKNMRTHKKEILKKTVHISKYCTPFPSMREKKISLYVYCYFYYYNYSTLFFSTQIFPNPTRQLSDNLALWLSANYNAVSRKRATSGLPHIGFGQPELL